MHKREFKTRIYNELAQITKALANAHRLEIIELLAQGDYSVEHISLQTDMSIANASQHLQVLKTAQLVDVTRNGTFIYYRLANANVFKTWKALRELGVERIASIEKLVKDFRHSKSKADSLTIDSLTKKLKTGKITILDVRPENEFHSGHIVNAVSIPIDKLRDRMKELPKRNEIVAYCRGPFCVYADEAVALLSKAGFKARRLEEGYPDWAINGLPIEVN
ncbi:MAG TPA: metalloregulator ArsR/SmtB family transcription factor [Chryseosolibacter sp.]|nr:metalloregulator ArsR/SmtB family transcription factor [Chryseosolibacter sp.]